MITSNKSFIILILDFEMTKKYKNSQVFTVAISMKKKQNRPDNDKLKIGKIYPKYEQVFPLAVYGKQ